MNTVRPRPYPQRGTGSYNAGNEGADKDGHNPEGNERREQAQNRQVVARGRAEDVQAPQTPPRAAIYTPANNAYPQQMQTYPAQPPVRPYQIQTNQVNPQQYQAIQQGYQPIGQQKILEIQLKQLQLLLILSRKLTVTFKLLNSK